MKIFKKNSDPRYKKYFDDVYEQGWSGKIEKYVLKVGGISPKSSI